jgi:nucleotide-binding universal stress UspA family protein
MRNAAQQRLDASLAGIDTSGIDIDADLVEGDARHVLIDAARDAELLVVGSHGRGQLAEAMLGSVSSFCVHHAVGPVVIVRARPEHSGDPEEASP